MTRPPLLSGLRARYRHKGGIAAFAHEGERPARAILLAAGLAAFAGLAQAEAVAEAPESPAPFVTVPVNLDGSDYLAEIDLSGAEPTLVNGVALDISGHLPGAVRISRADGATMADEGFCAREVLAAACATQGFRPVPAAVPVLSPGGRWIFPGGCE